MSQPKDADFYAERERQERALAACARDPAIARIHFEMAERYASRCRPTAAGARAG